MERAIEIEKGFKELHAGLYKWGDEVYEKAIKVGYIESADGWKLKLPKYKEFMEMKEKVEGITKYQWGMYKEGKAEYKRLKENPEYRVKNEDEYNLYKSLKSAVSGFFKLKSEYQRLCLNNPVQVRGAMMIKLATCLIFEWIEKNNLFWKVLIDNSIHDELVLETIEELGEKVREILQKFMIQAGNHYLKNLSINAEASIGKSWSSAKG